MNKRLRPTITLCLMVAVMLQGSAAAGDPADGPVEARREARSTVLFVPNRGQYPGHVHFEIRGADLGVPGGHAWATADSLWLSAVRPARGAAVRLRFDVRGAGLGPSGIYSLPTRINDFRGAGERWASGVPTFGALSWSGTSAGQEVAVESADGRLELSLPRIGTASWVRIGVEGAALRTTQEGVVADTMAGTIPLPQIRDGRGRVLQARVVGREILVSSAKRTGVGAHEDRMGVPVDDPEDLLYSTYLGGTFGDCALFGCALAVGPDGSAYVTGETLSEDFPTTPGPFDPTYNGAGDAFVSRLSPDGSTLIFSTYLGGTGPYVEAGQAIDVGSRGQVYVTGNTGSEDFPTTPNAYDPTFNEGREDAFLTILSPGGALVASSFLGGSGDDDGGGVAVGSDRSVYVTGSTGSTDFPTTPGAYDGSFGGGMDAFVSRLDPLVATLVGSTYLGGPDQDVGRDVALGPGGAALVTGETSSEDFPTTPGAFDRTCGGCSFGRDAFVSRLNRSLTTLQASTFVGGSDDDLGSAIALGPDAAPFVTGTTWSDDFPVTPGAFDVDRQFIDGFVAAFEADLSAPRYGTYLGGNSMEGVEDIKVTRTGAAVVTGSTDSPSFPTTPGAYDRTIARPLELDAYVTVFHVDGSALRYSTFLGGLGQCIDFACYDGGGTGIGLAPDGGVIVTGSTLARDFPTTPEAFDLTCGCIDGDAFVSKLRVLPG